MKAALRLATLLFIFVLILAAVSGVASASQSFYKDKTLTIVVPSGVGGTHDAWARLLAPFLKKKLDLASVKVINRPGAGGLIGTNYTYRQHPDGLTIGEILGAGAIFAQIQKKPGVKYDIGQFKWIGQIDDVPSLIFTHPNGDLDSFKKILALRGGNGELKALATGPGSYEYNAQVIVYRTFGIPARLVTGFKGSHDLMANFASGTGDASSLIASNLKNAGPSVVHPVLALTLKRTDLFPQTPSMMGVARALGLDKQKQEVLETLARMMSLGTAFFAPPGVPEARLSSLRKAFQEIAADPDFRRTVSDRNLYLGYMSPKTIEGVVDAALTHSQQFTEGDDE